MAKAASVFVDVGEDCIVRADQVLFVQAGRLTELDLQAMTVVPFEGVRCVIVLRDGVIVPGYYSARTIRKKLDAWYRQNVGEEAEEDTEEDAGRE